MKFISLPMWISCFSNLNLAHSTHHSSFSRRTKKNLHINCLFFECHHESLGWFQEVTNLTIIASFMCFILVKTYSANFTTTWVILNTSKWKQNLNTLLNDESIYKIVHFFAKNGPILIHSSQILRDILLPIRSKCAITCIWLLKDLNFSICNV